MIEDVASFYYFKQKTAYEMRISDWSSDVCASNLQPGEVFQVFHHQRVHAAQDGGAFLGGARGPGGECRGGRFDRRSVERRVGTDCVCTCLSRWSSLL